MWFAIFITSSAFAQKEGNIWYFSSAGFGLDFNVTPPRVMADGKMKTQHLPVTMADGCGVLQFYTGNYVIHNRRHEPMQGTEGVFPENGVLAAGQPAAASPHPGDDSVYYFFVLPVVGDPYRQPQNLELRYSVIDMRLDNKKGAVTVKNILLPTPGFNLGGITVARHENNRDFWLLLAATAIDTKQTVNSTKLYAFLINEQGLQAKPVTSDFKGNSSVQHIFASPDSRKISTSGELAFFDNASGQLTQSINNNSVYNNFSGGEFSPDGQKIYTIDFINPDNVASDPAQAIFQYQLKGTTTQDISATRYMIPKTARQGVRGLKLGPNGKIYATSGNSLGVIENPNDIGDKLVYTIAGVPGVSPTRLPNTIAGFALGKVKDFRTFPQCAGREVRFENRYSFKPKQWLWDFGDPASGSANTSDLPNPAHTFSQIGTYKVRLITLDKCNERDTLFRDVTIYPDPVLNLPDSITACYGKAPVLLTADGYPSTKYRWNTKDSTQSVRAGTTGWYSVTASNPCNTRRDSVYVDILAEAVARIPDDTVVCQENSAVLDAYNEGASYRWSTGETTRTIRIDRPGGYWVEITGKCNTVTDSANVYFVPKDMGAFIPNVFTPDGNGINDVFEPYVIGSPGYSLTICDRWGGLVFRSGKPFEFWDGTVKGREASAGMYYYAITARDCQGRPKVYRGWVSLLRAE